MPGGGHWVVIGERVVVGLVEVVEGRKRKERLGREGVDPISNDEAVALGLRVAQPVGSVVAAQSLPVGEAGIVGYIEVVLAVLGVESQLVFGRLIADERDEAALRVRRSAALTSPTRRMRKLP